MAGAIADAFVNVRANTRGFQSEVSTGVSSAFRGVARSAVGFAAAYGLGEIFTDTVMNASDLQESMNAVRVSFQDLGPEALAQLTAMGEGATTNMGMTQTAFNEAAVRFNAFSRNIAEGSGQDVVGVLSDITGRATDFASVMNLDVAEAQRLFQSGLAGETEPLRRFGIDISAAKVEAYALSEGIASSYDELSEAEKQMIRWQLVLDQTSTMQGDFANTSDQLANAMRIAQAEIKTAGIAFGQGLLPGLQDAINGMNEFLPTLHTQLEATGKAVGSALTPVFDAMGPAIAKLLEVITPIIEDFASIFGSLAPLLVPIIDLVGTIAGLFSGVLMNALHAFNPVIKTAAEFITVLADTLGTALEPVIRTITQVMYDLAPVFNEALLDILPIIVDLINELAPALGDLFEILAPLVTLFVEGLVIALQTLEPILPLLVKGFVLFKIAMAAANLVALANPYLLIAAAIVAIVVAIKAFYDRSVVFQAIISAMWEGLQKLWDVIVNGVVAAWQDHLLPILRPLEAAFTAIRDAVTQVIAVFKDFGGAIVDAFKTLFSGDFSGAFSQFKQAFYDLWDGLRDIDWASIGQRILTAFLTSLRIAWQKIQSLGEWLSGIWDKFMAWVDSVDWNAVGQAILDGLEAGASAAWDTLKTVGGWFADLYGKVTAWIDSVDWHSVAETILTSISNAVSTAWNALTSLATWFAGTPIGTKILNWVQNIKWGEIGKAIIGGIGDAVLTAFQGITVAATWFGDIVTKLSDWISGVDWDSVGENIGDWIGQLPGKLFSWIANAFSRGDSGASGKSGGTNWTTIVLNLLEALGKVFLALTVTLPAAIITALGELALGILKGLADALIKDENLQPVRDFFTDLPGKFLDWVSETASGLFDVGKRLILEIAAGFAEGAGDIPGIGRLLNLFGADDMAEAAREELARMDWPSIQQEFIDGWNSMFSDIPLNVEFGQQITIDNLISDFHNALEPIVPIIGEDAAAEIEAALNAAIPNGISAVEADSIQRLLYEKLADALGVDIADIPGLEGQYRELAGGIVNAANTAISAGFGLGGGGGGGMGAHQSPLAGAIGGYALSIGAMLSRSFDDVIVPTAEELPKKFVSAASKDPDALSPVGTTLITGLSGSIDKSLAKIQVTMLGLSVKFVAWLGNLSNTFTAAGIMLMAGFSAGMQIGIIPVTFAMMNLSNMILAWTSSLPLSLYARGIQVIDGFVSGMQAAMFLVTVALFSVSAYIASWSAGLSGVLVNAGYNMIAGLYHGIAAGAGGVYGLLWSIRNSIDNIFAGASSILYWAGVSVMAGFEAGLRAAWYNVLRFLQSANAKIPQSKGPPSVDRVLLEDAGRLVMQGFQHGLEGGWNDVTALLDSYTNELGVGGSGGSGASSIVVQSPNVMFSGALPTDAQAYGVGAQVGAGIADALARRRVRTLTRTGGS